MEKYATSTRELRTVSTTREFAPCRVCVEAIPTGNTRRVDLAELASLVRDVDGFPNPGVMFKDITPVLARAEALRFVVDAIADPFARADGSVGGVIRGVNKVAAIEARGFILGAPVALRLGAGFVPLRKEGKLPWMTLREGYSLEYGSETIEVHVDAFEPGDRVLLVDDVIATGGTAVAAAKLITQMQAELVGIAALLEIDGLMGRKLLEDTCQVPVHVVLRSPR